MLLDQARALPNALVVLIQKIHRLLNATRAQLVPIEVLQLPTLTSTLALLEPTATMALLVQAALLATLLLTLALAYAKSVLPVLMVC